MKRRTLKQLRSKANSDHHNVYVVLLDTAAGKLKTVLAANPERDPTKPCVYVGMSGFLPEVRFANHKAGIKAASAVRRYQRRLWRACSLIIYPDHELLEFFGYEIERWYLGYGIFQWCLGMMGVAVVYPDGRVPCQLHSNLLRYSGIGQS